MGLSRRSQGFYIGDVKVPLVAVPVSDSGSVGDTAALSPDLGSLEFGLRVTNTHADQDLYVGSEDVSATEYLVKLAAGETSDWLPFQRVYVLGSAADTTYCVAGG